MDTKTQHGPLLIMGEKIKVNAMSFPRKALKEYILVKENEMGYLDEQFIQLEELQDEANPNFVEEIVNLFYSDSARMIRNIDDALTYNPHDFNKLDDYMHQFKGSSSSIGAKKVKSDCSLFREYCKAGNAEGCIRTFQQVKQEHAILKRKLDAYFQLYTQARPSKSYAQD